jgi:hypothetical protein
VLRADYKSNKKWNAFVTYHFANTTRTGTEQFNILNTTTPSAVSGDPIKAWFGTFKCRGN